MRKQILHGLSALMVSAIAFSCTTTQKTTTADYDYLYVTKQGIIQKPLIADLEVGKQKSTVSRTYKDMTLNGAKETVMGEFIKENNCDLVVQPYFTSSSSTSMGGSTITVTVTGYPASYKNIRQFERKDTQYFLPPTYFFRAQEARPITNEVQEAPKKKGTAGKIAGGLLLAGAATYLVATTNNRY
ncbi:MAG: hypothetical protein EOO16_12960 [Chitinophagaceae bacterium]|nr:MAG: hypothetical protein EOO16_12960 [Chitinophagaceae bacterium]